MIFKSKKSKYSTIEKFLFIAAKRCGKLENVCALTITSAGVQVKVVTGNENFQYQKKIKATRTSNAKTVQNNTSFHEQVTRAAT